MLALDLSFLEKSLAEAGVLAKGDCSVSPRVSSVTGVILGPLAITVPRKQAFTLRPMHQWQWGGGGWRSGFTCTRGFTSLLKDLT